MVTYLPIALWLLLLAMLLGVTALAVPRDQDDLGDCPCEDCEERLELSDSQVDFQFRQIVADYDKEESL